MFNDMKKKINLLPLASLAFIRFLQARITFAPLFAKSKAVALPIPKN